jgi:hypothetical protein
MLDALYGIVIALSLIMIIVCVATLYFEIRDVVRRRIQALNQNRSSVTTLGEPLSIEEILKIFGSEGDDLPRKKD